MWDIYMVEYYSAIKKNETMLFTATLMHHSEPSKADRERQVSRDITCMWNLKHDRNEFI